MILAIPLILFLLQPEPMEFHYEPDLRYMEQVDDNLLDTI
jgi:hypothetical protein